MASASKGEEDDLLPGIPNHVTLHHIAPKLKWKTCNVLETMNRGWKKAMRSRSLYDERVRSHSTDPFIVLLSMRRGFDGEEKFVSTLYSCKDDSVLHLPPIPTEDPFALEECVCLDGKIYLWYLMIDDNPSEDLETVDDDSSKGSETEEYDSSEGSAKECLWVLDLAGDRKWLQRGHQRLSTWWPGKHRRFLTVNVFVEDLHIGYGVLDGEIYKFRGSTHRDRGVLNGAVQFQDGDDKRDPDLLPEAQVYDPRSDVWSRITPERSGNYSGSFSDDIAPIREWARDKFGADHSNAFSTDGWYEPYFSEWRRKYNSAPQSAIDVKPHNENQVYYRHTIYNDWYEEYLFFFGGKLAKFTRDTSDLEGDQWMHGEWSDAKSDIELYDTQINRWKQWISLKVNLHPPFGEDSKFSIVDFASTKGVIWAVCMVNRYGEEDEKGKYYLFRSPVLLDETSDSSVSWINTGHCLAENDARCIVRPIYL